MPDNPFLPGSTALRQMMRRGDTDGAIYLLHKVGNSPAAALSQRLAEGAQQYRAMLIDGENWSRMQLQLYQAILDWMPIAAEEAQSQPAALDYLRLRRLVDNHEIGAALAVCEALGDASILMQARYEINGKLYAEGTVGLETWEITQHQILYELWELAEEAESSAKASTKVCKRVRRWWKGR
jgi:hypothetical protein